VELLYATKVVGDAFIDLHVKVKLRPDRDERVHLSIPPSSSILIPNLPIFISDRSESSKVIEESHRLVCRMKLRLPQKPISRTTPAAWFSSWTMRLVGRHTFNIEESPYA
jgi:hypothetical protein